MARAVPARHMPAGPLRVPATDLAHPRGRRTAARRAHWTATFEVVDRRKRRRGRALRARQPQRRPLALPQGRPLQFDYNALGRHSSRRLPVFAHARSRTRVEARFERTGAQHGSIARASTASSSVVRARARFIVRMLGSTGARHRLRPPFHRRGRLRRPVRIHRPYLPRDIRDPRPARRPRRGRRRPRRTRPGLARSTDRGVRGDTQHGRSFGQCWMQAS